jgi:hypothetical protein
MAFDTEEDLLAAAKSREAEEGDHLELKRDLPPGEAGAREIAKDLAAMALGGGVILVGLDEGPPVRLAPILLAGKRERVENIARGVDPPVPCQLKVIRRNPPGSGYLVITVPISEDAPHAVQGKFYGRFGSISAPLKHAEVRRLFQERANATTGQGTTTQGGDPPIDQLLDEWVQADPTPEDQRRQAHIFVVVRPREATSQMLQDAVGTDWELWTLRSIKDGRTRLTHDWSPDVGSLSTWRRVPGGWRGSSDHGPWQVITEKRETHWIELEFREDGTVRLFNGRGSDHYRDGVRVIMEIIVGGCTRRALEAAIRVSEATGYEGIWDAGVALTNLAGAVSYFRMANWWVDAEDLPPYPEVTYRETWTGTAAQLQDDPDAVVDRLVGSINRTLNDGRFQLPAPPPPPEPEDDQESVTG